MEEKRIQDLEKEIDEFIRVNIEYFEDDGSPFRDGLNQSDFKYYYICHEDCEMRKIITKCKEEGKNYKKAFRQWISSSSVVSKLLDAIIGSHPLIMISAGNPHLGYLNQNWTYIYLLMSIRYGAEDGFYTCKFSIPSRQKFIIDNYHTKYNFSYFAKWFNRETKNSLSDEKLKDILDKTPLYDNRIMRLSKTELIDSINGYIVWNISICPHLQMQCKMNGSPDCPKRPASSADCPIRKALCEYRIRSCRKYYVDISMYDIAKLCASKNEMISYIKERHEKNTAKVIEEEKRREKEKEEKDRKMRIEEVKKDIAGKCLYANLKNQKEIEHIRTPEGKEEQRLKFKDFREEILRKNEGTTWAAHYPCIGGYSNPYKKEDGGFSIILLFSYYSTLKEIKEYLKSHDLRELAIYALDSCTGYHPRSQKREISDEEKQIRELINTAPIKGTRIDCWNHAEIYFLTEDPEVTKKKRIRRLKEKKRRDRKKKEEEEKRLERKADQYARKAKPSDEVVLVKDLDKLYKQIVYESSYEIEEMD